MHENANIQGSRNLKSDVIYTCPLRIFSARKIPLSSPWKPTFSYFRHARTYFVPRRRNINHDDVAFSQRHARNLNRVKNSFVTFQHILTIFNDYPKVLYWWNFSFPAAKNLRACTGRHFTLVQTSSWHQNKVCVLVLEPHTEIGQNLFPRLHDSPLGAGGESRNLGKRL